MKLFVVAALAALTLPAAAAFKCQTVDGKMTYQEIPCASAERQTAVRVFASPSPKPDEQGERSATERSAINRAIVGSYPVRGMTLQELQNAIGDPARINTGDYPGGYTEQRIYERQSATVYVYTHNGVVRSIQTTEAPRRAVAVASRTCASLHDIKNEEVSANSITLTPEQRQERYRKIERMRNCRD